MQSDVKGRDTRRSKKIMTGKLFRKEIERIYSPKNKHSFHGIPVHYYIDVTGKETVKPVSELLTAALYSNKRLLSRRITYIDAEYIAHTPDFMLRSLFRNSSGALVVIKCFGEEERDGRYADIAEMAIETILECMERYGTKVQLLFADMDPDHRVRKSVIAEAGKKLNMNFLELDEGRADKKAALSYLEYLLKRNRASYLKNDLTLPKKDDYFASDVLDRYSDIKRNSLKDNIYRAYKDLNYVKEEVPKTLSSSYEKLQKMVGLHDIKEVVDQIVAAQKLIKMRENMGLENTVTAKHMIFTGNPGSAKTTVARLLASILYDEHILNRNVFVECGRQDLVDRFVGWTAKAVEAKFREASGGILFIDEAYSLVDRSGSFGDEAINTIVQLMENYKDRVIVIFAGYPEKMRGFLSKNEGLRSRIAFHLDFPDYNSDELCEILELMSSERGYSIDSEAMAKCREIFDAACCNDEYGNGRFVRNVLEQAIMKQSSRIISEYAGKKVDKTALTSLMADDFNVNAADMYKADEKKVIGF